MLATNADRAFQTEGFYGVGLLKYEEAKQDDAQKIVISPRPKKTKNGKQGTTRNQNTKSKVIKIENLCCNRLQIYMAYVCVRLPPCGQAMYSRRSSTMPTELKREIITNCLTPYTQLCFYLKTR